jgi:hypothetical protein
MLCRPSTRLVSTPSKINAAALIHAARDLCDVVWLFSSRRRP